MPPLGQCRSGGQKESELITSPPARVINAFKVIGLIDFLMKRTDPSAKRH